MSNPARPFPASADENDLVRRRIGAQVLGPMISRGEFDGITEHFREVLDRARGVPPVDRERFFAALAVDQDRRDLAIAINGLMHGKRAIKQRFEHCLATLQRLDLATWPLLTVWLALLHPSRFRLIDAESAARLGLSLDWPGFCKGQRSEKPGQ